VRPQVWESIPSSACQPGGDNVQARVDSPALDDFFSRIPFTVLRKHFDLTPGHRPLHCFGERTDDVVLAADTRVQHLNGLDCLAVDDDKADRSIDSKSQAVSLSCTRELFRFFPRRLIDHGHWPFH
jgi:hypothetical protein